MDWRQRQQWISGAKIRRAYLVVDRVDLYTVSNSKEVLRRGSVSIQKSIVTWFSNI